jgi:hypothetical protein
MDIVLLEFGPMKYDLQVTVDRVVLHVQPMPLPVGFEKPDGRVSVTVVGAV